MPMQSTRSQICTILRTLRFAIARVYFFAGLAIAAALFASCAGTGSTPLPSKTEAGSAQGATTASAQSAAAGGFWIGTTNTYTTSDIRKITLRIDQSRSGLTGEYNCEAGNTFCRNMDSRGIISGSVAGDTIGMTITMLPDTSQCFYNGRASQSSMSGTYHCVQEGALVELGGWQVKRLGADSSSGFER